MSGNDPVAHDDVVARRLGRLNAESHRLVAPLCVEPVDDRLQQRRLPCLPGSVQDEVLLRVDELLNLGPIDAREGVDAVVLRGLVGASGVEVSVHRYRFGRTCGGLRGTFPHRP